MNRLLVLLFLLGTTDCFAQVASSDGYRDRDLNKLELYKQKREQAWVKKHQNDNAFKSNPKYKPTWIDYLKDEQSFGATYNYSKHFPIGFSGYYSISMFMISYDFGLNTDKDKYVTNKISDYKDDNNYLSKTITRDPKAFATFTPQFYLKYFSVGCGIGALILDKDEVTTSKSSSSTSSGNTGSSVSVSGNSFASSSAKGGETARLMIRPEIKGFVPISVDFSLVVSAGYDYVLNFKEKNGFNVGIGLQWVMDY